ncbi:NAD(P)-dependent dehydrogenase (short-subunit alcohol dehydrogenase family) [Pseudoduganella lurida]|uniref:NAD(P)-dependent dehydrogenase (Short-subunit alcohol dehydrogenase family) n=1 Tax=Pseudoduganella lurida TaxID=1036180 RepID=A0A562RL93_9BURK|nr:SDR family oxidoreductase [Pseudoduganella lurida]TWI69817.1 NAD(P)-dependent dehydrogenase (short-subunit alcohol dehydrogenase family) [Pseudoduganella lurida]
MHIQFTNRRVLVTGSTAGIGFATAKGFLAAGAQVIINGRSQQSVDAAIAKLGDAGRAATGFVGDLGTAEGCAALVAAHPDIDILVNNLGVFGPQDFFDIPDSEWERFFQVNVMSGVRLSKAYAPGMVERGWGRIVFISSESAVNIPSDMIHYGFSKTAQLAVSRGLAKRLAGTGVNVNAVLPGPTLSEGVADMLKEDVARTGSSLEQVAADFVVAQRGSSILRRAASVEEVANMVLYASSEQAAATTGAALRVDGGVIDTIV